MSVQYHKADPVGLEFQFRALPDGTSVFEGYASIFNQPSKPIRDELARGRPYRETIMPGAFRRTLGSRRQTLVVDHDESRMISFAPGGPLRLAEDSKGLHVESPWPNADYANNVRALYEAGNPLGMSILFGVPARTSDGRPGEVWSPDFTARTVNDAILKHASVLAALEPAYDGTVASFRALADMTDAPVEDVDALVEALREGRRLDDAEFNLLSRLTEAVRPEPPTPATPAELPAKVQAILAKLDAAFPTS